MATAASPKRSYGKQLALLVHEYMDAHGTDAIDLHEVAAWAVRTGKYERRPPSLVQLCARELSRAMRNEYITDPQGRAVRRMHPARYPSPSGRQMVIWADLFKAEPKHIRVSMQQRR